MTIRQQPLPPEWPCLAGRDDYMRENGFRLADLDAPTSLIVFFGMNMTVPNPPRHRYILRLHDLHHVLTGYGTCHIGEGELAMWEWRAGVFQLDAWAIFLTIITGLMGFVYAPGRMLRAWRASKAARPLWATTLTYDQMLGMTIGELRAACGIPAEGIAYDRRRLHKNAPLSKLLQAGGAT